VALSPESFGAVRETERARRSGLASRLSFGCDAAAASGDGALPRSLQEEPCQRVS